MALSLAAPSWVGGRMAALTELKDKLAGAVHTHEAGYAGEQDRPLRAT